MRSFALPALVFAAGTSARSAPRNVLDARDIVNVGPSGVCPAVPTVTVQIQPVYYSEYIPYNIVIDPFRNGHPTTILNAPTTVVTSGQLTTTIFPGSTSATTTASGASSTSASSASSGSGASSGASSTESATTGSATGSASGSASGSSDSGSSTASGSATGSVTGSATATDTTGSVITPSPSTTAGPSDSTASSTATVTTTASFNVTNLTFGRGLPNGAFNNLPTETFLLLAVATPGGGLTKREAPMVARQVVDPSATASACVVVNLSPSSVPGAGVSQDDCDDSTGLNIINGRLVRGDRSIGKIPGSTSAIVGFLPAGVEGTDTGFSIVNGKVQWNAPDTGAAAFYNCDGTIYAEFGAPPAGCQAVDFGAVAGQACIDRIVATGGTPNPDFTDPATPSSTSASVSASISASLSASASASASASLSASASASASLSASASASASLSASASASASASLSASLSASAASSAATPSGTGTSNPSNNTCEGLTPVYTSENSKSYTIQCDTLYTGTFLTSGTYTDFRSCVEFCSITDGCQALSYGKDSTANTFMECTLLSAYDPTMTTINAEFDGALFTNGTVQRLRYLYH